VPGCKLEPALAPNSSFGALACVLRQAARRARLSLIAPALTVMTTVLTSGYKPANDLALESWRGLRTGMLYLEPRPPSRSYLLKPLVRGSKHAMILRCLVARHGKLYMTGPIVDERTGVQLLEVVAAPDHREAGTGRIAAR
jgi:hypothetical protein